MRPWSQLSEERGLINNQIMLGRAALRRSPRLCSSDRPPAFGAFCTLINTYLIVYCAPTAPWKAGPPGAMGLEVVGLAFPTLLGVVGAVVLLVSLLAALLINRSDSKRKAGVYDKSAKSTVALVEAVADSRERCTILFGTQTGTAERCSKQVRA